jgi:phosphatidylinositol 4-kinase A
LDPFFVKQEFGPSDRALITRRQTAAYELIAPHLKLLQFLSSHFSASRLGTPHVQRIYQRLINITLDATCDGMSHPLAREAFLHIILLGLKILRFSTNMDPQVVWRFKDRLLSAALSWFSYEPMYVSSTTTHKISNVFRWSYGGNRIQLQAETHLISDALLALDLIKHIGMDSIGSRKSLAPKQELLEMLLVNEQSRLHIWLFPLESEKRFSLPSHHHQSPTEVK